MQGTVRERAYAEFFSNLHCSASTNIGSASTTTSTSSSTSAGVSNINSAITRRGTTMGLYTVIEVDSIDL
jgi:hypothetical protein